jgi:hypothetical protein
MTERDQLAGFIRCVVSFLRRNYPSDAMEAIAESFSRIDMARARISGVREGARDMVEWCQDFSAAQVSVLDQELSLLGLPTFTSMRDRRYRELLKVLARGRVKTESEYRLLEGYLSDTDNVAALSQQELARATQMLGEFHVS